ncbi:MAG: translation elongation factor Ts [Bacilli bacterium]|nr:translation elongation factor Ts [Erysipelotrichaceae bacterium]MDD6249605.1 translation elongation factor Ts [Bacillales bacterium]MDY3890254.1 translation elongation factor Ts [Bacilli bacterium]
MASNVIELIKVLRDRTGAGMMDCKKALMETDCDVEKAVEWLREKGIAKVAKKASRIAAEGLTHVVVNGNEALILEINSETDFVSKSDAFKNLVVEVANVVLASKPANIEAAKALTQDIFTNATIKIGEKLDFRRFELVTKSDDQTFGSYIHMGGKISVLVVENGANAEVAKGLAMQIAANNPQYITTSDIPAEAIEKEKAVQMEAAKNDEKLKDKPEQALVKIIEGKVNKIFAESVLVKQDYLLDPSQKVEQVLTSNKISVAKFVRYQVGEGIAKREENFAEEVAKQMN